ncbi:MAG: 4-hydroxy-tetrahydrodipicolinate synthase [Desulfobacteraceae bacterium]|nr:4-hydroxy-tetrahydrodipicolinate synthase [Desulfobacteraceae bacterium]MBC2754430.1 4-hydroxy-tetrahydrodipicolinate synthase [Desulfobacteraceae bacterium]
MHAGCYTAIITPFTKTSVDYDGLEQLVKFQIHNGITGILAVGTTGESPTLNWNEHNRVIQEVAENSKNQCACIAGTGSNNSDETLSATEHAVAAGVDAVLLVDPYYNGPSSLEIRKEYVEPVAREFSTIQVIPYVIPGRTGAQLLPEDLAILAQNFENVGTVKEATGDLDNMKQTRKCCGTDYVILSGDDGLTFDMMTDPDIDAAGAISVISNVAPKAVSDMVNFLNQGKITEAKKCFTALAPLFGLVTVKTMEKTTFGDVTCRARNPLAVKTLMNILGMPSGPCRRPLGKMTQNGIEKVLAVVRKTQADNPEILAPVAEFFNVDIDERINTPKHWESLSYQSY